MWSNQTQLARISNFCIICVILELATVLPSVINGRPIKRRLDYEEIYPENSYCSIMRIQYRSPSCYSRSRYNIVKKIRDQKELCVKCQKIAMEPKINGTCQGETKNGQIWPHHDRSNKTNYDHKKLILRDFIWFQNVKWIFWDFRDYQNDWKFGHFYMVIFYPTATVTLVTSFRCSCSAPMFSTCWW